jgi:hypothetical protein
VYTNTNTDHLGIYLTMFINGENVVVVNNDDSPRYFDDVEYCVMKSIKRVGTRVMETASANMALRRNL